MPLIFIILLFPTLLAAQTRDFQTTRMISTAGAGAASITFIDSAQQNPASIGFFSKTEVSYQYNQAKYESSSSPQQDNKYTQHGLFVGDAGKTLKGTVKYTDTQNLFFKQKAYGITFAKQRSKRASTGAKYEYKEIKNKATGQREKRHILTIGNTQFISPNVSTGIIITDPFDTKSFEHRVITGLQIQLAKSIYLMGDMLTNQRFKNFSDTLGWRAAVAMKLYKKIYARAGISRDKRDNIKEFGYGIDLRLEKFFISAALKKTEVLDTSLASTLPQGTESTDLVISASIRF